MKLIVDLEPSLARAVSYDAKLRGGCTISEHAANLIELGLKVYGIGVIQIMGNFKARQRVLDKMHDDGVPSYVVLDEDDEHVTLYMREIS